MHIKRSQTGYTGWEKKEKKKENGDGQFMFTLEKGRKKEKTGYLLLFFSFPKISYTTPHLYENNITMFYIKSRQRKGKKR